MTSIRILIIILLLIPLCAFGQKKRKNERLTPEYFRKYSKISEIHSKCFFNGKLSADERRAIFPFNEGLEVRLISYEWDFWGGADNTDSLPLFIPVAASKYAINQLKLKEQKTLNQAGVDSLTNIFFNYGYTPVRSNGAYVLEGKGSCYEPHNAVVFLDTNGKVKYYFMVCFSCWRHYWSTSKVKNVIYCDGKYELLRKFFASQGIIYGTRPLHNSEE